MGHLCARVSAAEYSVHFDNGKFRIADGKPLAVLAVKELPHRLPASLIRFAFGLAFVGIHATPRCGTSRFRGAACGAAVGKAGLSGFSSNSSEQRAHILMGKFIPIHGNGSYGQLSQTDIRNRETCGQRSKCVDLRRSFRGNRHSAKPTRDCGWETVPRCG